MNVLLIAANTEQINMPAMPLGLACVAEAAKNAGHEVAMLDLMFEENVAAALADAVAAVQPECIGLSVRNIDDQNMEAPRFLLEETRDIVAACRNLSSAPIVVGGAGYTMFPESALAYLDADMGIAGEGETAFPALLAHIEQGRDPADIPGLTMRGRGRGAPTKAFTDNLDAHLLPDPGFLTPSAAKNPAPWIPVQTRRGCPLNCAYCSTPCIEGTRVRKRDPEQVVAWLEKWVQAGYSNFFFVDNTFNLPASYAKELCRRMIERDLDIHWQGIIYPKRVDEELAALMAEAGCVHISLGFESGSPRILRQMNKRFSPDEVREVSDLFAAHNIERMGFLLFGAPGETRETVEESLAFADSLGLELLSLTAGIRLCPDTALAATAREEGMPTSQDDLLPPRFYLAPGLESWLPTHLRAWAASRPNVMM